MFFFEEMIEYIFVPVNVMFISHHPYEACVN